jgi:hypothetical protein
MADGFVLGLDCKLYLGSTEVTNATDVELTLETDEADVTTRGGDGWEQTVQTLKKAAVNFDMIWDPGDDAFEAIKNAYMDKTPIEDVKVLDGEGGEGLVCDMAVLKFTRTEPLKDAAKVAVTLKPTRGATPTWQAGSGS